MESKDPDTLSSAMLMQGISANTFSLALFAVLERAGGAKRRFGLTYLDFFAGAGWLQEAATAACLPIFDLSVSRSSFTCSGCRIRLGMMLKHAGEV